MKASSTDKRQPERGVALGIVLILLVILLLGGGLAVWGLRSETASAGTDRLSRQLFDCAEQGLAWGKTYFSTSGLDWSSYFNSSNVCTYFPCPPFVAGSGTAPSNYPNGTPYTQTVTAGGINLTFTV